ncbi:MAG: MBL fold metallo-hydrolase [Desulfarculus sp.]|nr:MBL fold metallo-hydrolase [Desulfarculus sp.]
MGQGRLSDRVWRLGSYHSAVYLLRGDGRAALFEAGIAAVAPLVLAQLDGLGVPREEVTRLVISHAHADHAGGQAALRAGLPRARLVLTTASRQFLEKPATAARYAQEEAFTSREVARRDGLALPCPSCLPLLPPPLAEVPPGHVLDLGGLEARLIEAPGHAPGGLICHLPQEGVVLAADSAGFCTRGRAGFPLYFVSYRQYQDSLAAIAAHQPAALGLGHQDCFSGRAASAYLAATRDNLEREHLAILGGLRAGQDPEAIAQGLLERYYQDELTAYPADSILNCSRLLVRRSREAGPGKGA